MTYTATVSHHAHGETFTAAKSLVNMFDSIAYYVANDVHVWGNVLNEAGDEVALFHVGATTGAVVIEAVGPVNGSVLVMQWSAFPLMAASLTAWLDSKATPAERPAHASTGAFAIQNKDGWIESRTNDEAAARAYVATRADGAKVGRS